MNRFPKYDALQLQEMDVEITNFIKAGKEYQSLIEDEMLESS